MAGLLPYVATSLSTVYLAWDINHASLEGQGFLLSGESAEILLHIIEPLQMGYGAVVRIYVHHTSRFMTDHAYRLSHSWEQSIGV